MTDAATERFHANVKAISDSIDQRDRTISELSAALSETHAWVRRIQDVMTGYLVPDGYDEAEALSRLIEMLDGPEQREIQGRAFAALAKIGGAQHDPWQPGSRVRWARSLEQRPLAVVDLDHVTIAGRFAPLSITLREVAGVFPLGWFDLIGGDA